MTNNFAILRIDKIKSVSRAGDRLRHNRRLIPCVTATPGVKNARVILNEQMRKDSIPNAISILCVDVTTGKILREVQITPSDIRLNIEVLKNGRKLQ